MPATSPQSTAPPKAPAFDPLTILLTHDEWATRTILERARSLSPEQLDRRFEMGLGSVRATLTHMLGAMQRWTRFMEGNPFMQRMEDDPPRSPDELLALHPTISRDFAAAARAKPLSDFAEGERGGKHYRFTRGGVLTHVTTHAVHHRAQLLNMLRHLGDAKPPDVSVLTWMLTVETVA